MYIYTGDVKKIKTEDTKNSTLFPILGKQQLLLEYYYYWNNNLKKIKAHCTSDFLLKIQVK